MDAERGERRQADDEAWAALRARWSDEEAHRAFLARFPELESLAEAGRRYREVLDRSPEDPMARRFRDEILRRATVLAMAQLPRTKPPRTVSPGARRAILAAGLAVGAAAVAWMISQLSAVAKPGVP